MTFRVPLYPRPEPQRPVQLVDVTELPLAIATFVPPVVPFSLKDWPLPKPAPIVGQIGQQVIVGNYQLTVVTGLAPPFKQTDWRLPKPAPIVGQIGQNVIVGNFQLTVVTGLAPPFKQNDWPYKFIDRKWQPDDRQNFIGLDPSKGIPFTQRQWPYPGSQKYQQIFDYRNLLLTTLTPSTAVPFIQFDWTWPKAKASILDYSFIQNLQQTTLAPSAAIPFNQADWNNLAVKKYQQFVDTQNLLALRTFVPATVPFNTSDWPNLSNWKPQPYADQKNLLALMALTPAAAPFAQIEWVIPILSQILSADNPPNLVINSEVIPPVPPPTINYQGDGKKRRKKKRSETQQLFDAIEKTLYETLYGIDPEEVSTEPLIAKIDITQGINEAIKQLIQLSAENTDLTFRLEEIRRDVYLYEQKLIEDDNEDFMMFF